MIVIACSSTSCRHALQVTGDPEEIENLVGERSEFWPSGYTCYNCGKHAEYYLTAEVSELAFAKLHVANVNAQEAYAALNGFGLPDERMCCEEVVLPLFEQAGIKVKGGRPRGQTFFRLEELTFADGTTLFLAPSAQGVVVFRVRKPHSYATEVSHEG